MKRTHLTSLLALAGVLLATNAFSSDPRLDAWLTAYSGKYARLYLTDADKNSGNAVSTWSRGMISQAMPAYCGVYEASSSATYSYVRTTGLGSHTMGPWYGDAAHTTLFMNVPKSSATLFRIPRTPAVAATIQLTGLGPIGVFVDGVVMFDTRDAFSYVNSTASEANPGDGIWSRDAWVNESMTFDPALAHQPGSGQYHYHANAIALRSLLGDNVNFIPATKLYVENTNTATPAHSPILGWVRDGYPVYGPYGYSVSNSAASEVRRMVSGFVPRAINLASVSNRTTLPAWAGRAQNRSTTLAANQYGPVVSATRPFGRYLEDNDYLGDLGVLPGTNTFDLDEFNGRWCVTPEFPGGIWAYFVNISSNGTPVFPYNVARTFFGTPTGNTTTLAETVTTNFLGGANSRLRLSPPVLSNNVVTLTWSAAEGGTYRVESTPNFTTWTTNTVATNAVLNRGSTSVMGNGSNQFFKVTRTALATYDP